MSNNPQKPILPNDKKAIAKQALHNDTLPDERYPGTFFRVPGVPLPGKTTWSLVK